MSQQINLFNPAFLRQKKVFTARTMLVALFVLFAGSSALLIYGRHSVAMLSAEAAAGGERLNASKKRQAMAMVDFAPRSNDPAVARQLAEAEAELAGLNEVVAVLQRDELGNTKGYAGYFKALARQSDGELWLTGVAVAGAGRQIGLRGRALQPAMVPAYVKRLAREPVMQGKDFGSLSINRASLTPPAAGATAEPKAAPVLAPYVDFQLRSMPAVQQAQLTQPAPAPGVAK